MKVRALLCLRILLLLLPQGLTAQSVPALFHQIEVKVHPPRSRLAGTVELHYRGADPGELGAWTIPEGLNVDKVLVNDEARAFRFSNGQLTLQAAAGSNGRQRVQVIFYGTPRQGAIWQQDAAGNPWVQLAGPASWHPTLPTAVQSADSTWMTLIAPKTLRVLSDRPLKQLKDWPGPYQAWTFVQPNQVPHADYYLGDYVCLPAAEGGETMPTNCQIWLPQAHQAAAGRYYQDLPGIMQALTDAWGIPPGPTVQRWIEAPGSSPGEYQQLFPGYSPGLVQQVARSWVGERDSPLRQAALRYAEWRWVQARFGEVAVQTYRRQRAAAPSNRGAWLLDAMAEDAPRAWERLWPGLLAGMRNGRSEAELRSYLCGELRADLMPAFEQWLDLVELPELHLRVVKQRRKWTIHYQWKYAVPGFTWPVTIFVQGKPYRLQVTDQLQKHALGRAGGRNVSVDDADTLFTVRME